MTHSTRLQIDAMEDRLVPTAMLVLAVDVQPVAPGLVAPTTMAFLGDNDLLVLEKISDKVERGHRHGRADQPSGQRLLRDRVVAKASGEVP
ncbi:MAG TPA: hypothetical protein VKE74_32400 [Gemmataceae bacterium]|nr:hypothetical protein [Gemmataceae bacterium]